MLVLIVAPLTILGLALFMTKTRFGLMVRASASNPDTARVFGISVKRTSTIVWAIAGGFAAVTAILIAPHPGHHARQRRAGRRRRPSAPPSWCGPSSSP